MDPFLLAAVAALGLVALKRRGAPPVAPTAGGAASAGGPSALARFAAGAGASGALSRFAAAVGPLLESAGARAAGQTGFAGGVQPPRLFSWKNGYGDRVVGLPPGVLQAEVPWTPLRANGPLWVALDETRAFPWRLGDWFGQILADSDGVMWVSWVNDVGVFPPEFWAGTMLREHRATGKTEACSRWLWAHNLPRLVKVGEGWELRGAGADELAAGRFNDAALVRGWLTDAAALGQTDAAMSIAAGLPPLPEGVWF